MSLRVEFEWLPIPIVFPVPGQPYLRAPMRSRQLLLGERTTVALEWLFWAPPSTTFSATSSSAAVQVSISGDSLVLEPRSLGRSEIVVTASNDSVAGLHPVHQVFDVVVHPPGTPPNDPPRAFRTLPRVIPVGFRVSYDISEFFRDPEDRPLTFSATSDAPEHVAVSASGSLVILEGKGRGEAVITVVATDHGGLPVRAPLPVSAIGWIDDR